MKLIEQSYEICKTHGYTIEDIYKDIEMAARISYKSEDKIEPGSAEKMVKRLINMKHYSPLEFGTVYMVMTDKDEQDKIFLKQFCINRFTAVKDFQEGDIHKWYITTNYRVIVEHHWEHIMNKYLHAPTIYHERRTIAKFICPRIISQMFMRHRVFSFLQESQRYINYSKDKFGNEITYIIPIQCREDIKDGTEIEDPISAVKFIWGERNESDTNLPKVNKFTRAMLFTFCTAETDYISLVNEGYKPQQARAVLPNYTATSFYMCGFKKDWDDFFAKRDIPQADPQMYDLVHKLHSEFIEKNK